MHEATVRVDGLPSPLLIRINGPRRTFTLAADALAQQALQVLDPVLLDLLEIAATVFAADGTVPRGGATRQDMGTNLCRQFDFDIPVRDPALWRRPDVSQALKVAVETLTDDSVSFRFSPWLHPPPPEPYLDLDPAGAAFAADEVVLFSGGLNSFAGALENSCNDIVAHRSGHSSIGAKGHSTAGQARRVPAGTFSRPRPACSRPGAAIWSRGAGPDPAFSHLTIFGSRSGGRPDIRRTTGQFFRERDRQP